MATSKFQALWNHPAGPKTSQFFNYISFLLYLINLINNPLIRPPFADSDFVFIFDCLHVILSHLNVDEKVQIFDVYI